MSIFGVAGAAAHPDDGYGHGGRYDHRGHGYDSSAPSGVLGGIFGDIFGHHGGSLTPRDAGGFSHHHDCSPCGSQQPAGGDGSSRTSQPQPSTPAPVTPPVTTPTTTPTTTTTPTVPSTQTVPSAPTDPSTTPTVPKKTSPPPVEHNPAPIRLIPTPQVDTTPATRVGEAAQPSTTAVRVGAVLGVSAGTARHVVNAGGASAGHGGTPQAPSGPTTGPRYRQNGRKRQNEVQPGGSVIQRFVRVIPTELWVALGAALALAAFAGIGAFWVGLVMRRQAARLAAVSAAALTDPLTGVLNRRGFISAAERELARAQRYDRPFVLAYVDVQGLKRVNDTGGHRAGDELLKEVAGLLSESARADDVVGRIGGDELALLLAEQSADGGIAVTERIRAAVPERRAEIGLPAPWDLTIGTAAYPADGATVDDLLAAADRRLYEQRGIVVR